MAGVIGAAIATKDENDNLRTTLSALNNRLCVVRERLGKLVADFAGEDLLSEPAQEKADQLADGKMSVLEMRANHLHDVTNGIENILDSLENHYNRL